jgi:hypothetical protein
LPEKLQKIAKKLRQFAVGDNLLRNNSKYDNFVGRQVVTQQLGKWRVVA